MPSGLWVPPGLSTKDRLDVAELQGIPRRVAITRRIMGLQANDSILVTPGSGATVATHLVSSKEYQVMMLADHLGHIYGSRDRWLVYYTPTTNAASREVAELFNADATQVVRVHGLWIIPTLTSITGVQIGYDINKITSVGTTGSTTVTPRAMDSTQAALDADITARFGSTAGAALDFKYFEAYIFNDETNPSTGFIGYQNLLPLVGFETAEFVLRQNQGIQIKQQAAGTVGLTGALIYFTTATE